jgi:Fur family ferric uptake transcriptional regulator
MTPQRRVVAEVLGGEHVHLTAESVHSAAQLRLPEISLATVYNTLNELVSMGEVIEVSARTGPKRYDPNSRAPHHHLVCTTCGTMRDVFPVASAMSGLSEEDRAGFELTGLDIVFRGRCPACATADSNASYSAGTTPIAPRS